MSGRRNAGRIELAGLWLGIAGGAVVAAVVLAVLFAREGQRSAPSDARAPDADLAALARSIGALDARLVSIERALALGDSRGVREPAAAGRAAGSGAAADPSAAAVGDSATASALPSAAELHADLLQMSKRIDLLASSIQENRKPAFVVPTLEQIHAARRDVDWAFVESVRQLCTSDPAQALERVRLMTFDDLLRKVGVPTEIRVTDDGSWIYARESHDGSGRPYGPGIRLRFVGDSVSFVNLW